MRQAYLKAAAVVGVLAVVIIGLYWLNESSKVYFVSPKSSTHVDRLNMKEFVIYKDRWVALQDVYVGTGFQFDSATDQPYLVRVGDRERRSEMGSVRTFFLKFNGENPSQVVQVRLAPDAGVEQADILVTVADEKLLEERKNQVAPPYPK